MSRTLKAEPFIEAACRETGLEDFGIPGWRENLDALIDSLNREAALSETGAQLVWQWMLRRLTNRLRVVEFCRQHPELESERVRRPLFVCGMMRTGTTILYEVLHTDPRARCLMKWESMACVPPPRAGMFDADPRLIQARKEVEEVFARTPDAKAAHYEAPDGPTECVELLTQHFAAQDWSWWRVPSYLEHFNRCDMHGAMAYHRQCLQLLQSAAPGPWRLKAPAHLLSLDALFDTYPDALVVVTHRDPIKCVASMAHMSCTYRPEILSDVHTHADLERYYGALWLENLGTMVDKMMDFRARRPDASVYDVHYRDFIRDPLAVVARVYEFLGEPLTAELESRMRRHLDENPGDRFGARKFTPEQFGLSDAAVRERFEKYYERFEIVRDA
jgi:hypothetical protein